MKNIQLTTNFNISEFRCKDGTDVPKEFEANIKSLAENLQKIRDRFVEEIGRDIAIDIVSGYRTKSHNEKSKGAKKSQHLIGKAADIRLINNSRYLESLYLLISEMIDLKDITAGGLTFYKNRAVPFIHYDIRGVKTQWKT